MGGLSHLLYHPPLNYNNKVLYMFNKKEYMKEYYLKNKEKLKKYGREQDKIRRADPECIKKKKEYIQKNIDKIKKYQKEYHREYQLKNKEHLNEYKKNWKKQKDLLNK